mgnify:CR=1 FL=1
MDVSGLPFDIEDANQGCELYYHQAIPLINERKYEESIPILVESLRLLSKCSFLGGKAHPRQFGVWSALVQSIEATGKITFQGKETGPDGQMRGWADLVKVYPLNDAQKARIESVGVLAASGLIAGEALTGLGFATIRFFDWKVPAIFAEPSYLTGIVAMIVLAFVMLRLPLAKAGRPEDPAAPAAMM